MSKYAHAHVHYEQLGKASVTGHTIKITNSSQPMSSFMYLVKAIVLNSVCVSLVFQISNALK